MTAGDPIVTADAVIEKMRRIRGLRAEIDSYKAQCAQLEEDLKLIKASTTKAKELVQKTIAFGVCKDILLKALDTVQKEFRNDEVCAPPVPEALELVEFCQKYSGGNVENFFD